MDRYVDTDGSVGLIVHPHKDFQAILKHGYDHDFLRALAHKLGIERFRWKNIWLPADVYLADTPHSPEELITYQERTAAHLEAAGHLKEAAAYRQQVRLPARKKELSLVN